MIIIGELINASRKAIGAAIEAGDRTPDHAYGIQTIYQYVYPNPVPDYKNQPTDLLQSCGI